MINNLKNTFWGDDVDGEVRVFNNIHLISIIGLLFSAVLSYIFIPEDSAFYMTIGIAIMAMLTFVEANRTHNYRIPVIIMSIFFNFFYLPYLFIAFGKYTCMIQVYFIFGLLYSILLINDHYGVLMVFIQTAFHIILIIYFISYRFDNATAKYATFKDYLGVYIAIVFSGLIGGMAVKFKITQQKKETTLADVLHSQLMQDYMSKNIFLINMSHEIRTPMNAIVGTVNLLLEQDINEHVRDCVYNILNSCNALLSITNELMDISKADLDEIPLTIVRYDLNEMIIEITNMMSVRLMDSHVSLYIELDENMPRYLYGDSAKIRQIFVNLLNNAVKYTNDGKIILRIKSTPIDSENVQFYAEIEDTGMGIKEENLEKLFKVYSRVQEDEQRQIEGTGLGLTLCQEYIRRMNGHINVTSTYHVGSIFSFDLPQKIDGHEKIVNINPCRGTSVLVLETEPERLFYLKRILSKIKIAVSYAEDEMDFKKYLSSESYTHILISYENYTLLKDQLNDLLSGQKLVLMSDIAQIATIEQSGCILTRPINLLNLVAALSNETNNYVHEIIRKGGFVCPKATIMVVDDNITNITVANGILRKYNATVLTALSGKECLTVLESHHVDMIFLDYMMPEMNGIDTLEAIRKLPDPYFAKLPIISLTANVVNGAREMFLNAGFDDYISKPIEVERIERALKTFLPRDYIEIKTK